MPRRRRVRCWRRFFDVEELQQVLAILLTNVI